MPSCFTVSGSENERQNFALLRSAWRYSTPSAGFSDFRSPLRTSVPSFTSTLMSSLFIPGSSARIRYDSLLSKTSTAGYHFDVLSRAEERSKFSSNRSLNTERRLPKPANGSHLTSSIGLPPYAEKLSTAPQGVKPLDKPPTRAYERAALRFCQKFKV